MTSYRPDRCAIGEGASASQSLSRNSSLSTFASNVRAGSIGDLALDHESVRDTIREIVRDATAEMRSELRSLRTEVKDILIAKFQCEAQEQHNTATALLPPCTADQLIIDVGEGSQFETMMSISLQRLGGVVLELRTHLTKDYEMEDGCSVDPVDSIRVREISTDLRVKSQASRDLKKFVRGCLQFVPSYIDAKDARLSNFTGSYMNKAFKYPAFTALLGQRITAWMTGTREKVFDESYDEDFVVIRHEDVTEIIRVHYNNKRAGESRKEGKLSGYNTPAGSIAKSRSYDPKDSTSDLFREGESSDRRLIDDKKRESANVSALKNEAVRREHLDREACMRESNVVKTGTMAKVRTKRSIPDERTDVVPKKLLSQPEIHTMFGRVPTVEATNDESNDTEEDDDDDDEGQSHFSESGC